MSRKKQKVSHESSEIVDFCYRSSTSQKVLSDLPDEILVEISGYLTPESLVHISRLGIQRLTKATFFKSADFSKCNTINNENLKFFFIKERLNLSNIKEINFNNVFFALPSTLTTCIQKCKNLTKLCAFNCGLDFSHICRIFDSCKILKELYWSLKFVDEQNPSLEMPNGTVTNLKKLGILIEYEKWLTIYQYLNAVFYWCSSLQVLFALSHPYNNTMSATLDRNTPQYFIKSFKSKHNSSETYTAHYDLFSCGVNPQRLGVFMQDISWMKDNCRQGSSGAEESEEKCSGYYHAGILQLLTENILRDPLPSLPDNSVKSLNILMSDNFRDFNNYLPRIAKMGDKTLKHLSIRKQENETTLARNNFINCLSMASILRDLMLNSYNLTALDLSEVHIPSVFPFNYPFKQLKVMHISACSLAPCPTILGLEPICFPERDFEIFVLNCDKVEEFGLHRCSQACRLGPAEETLNCISSWKELKSLTLKFVGTVRKCQFLTGVANKCPKLRKLVLVELGNPKVCHFIPSVVHILKKSKELIFLRLNQSGFFPMDTFFWRAVSSSLNLQGLCLSTAVTTYIVNKPVLGAINNLPFLHIFHLKARGTSENLSTHVKRIMLRKGVKVPKIMILYDHTSVAECYQMHLAMI